LNIELILTFIARILHLTRYSDETDPPNAATLIERRIKRQKSEPEMPLLMMKIVSKTTECSDSYWKANSRDFVV